MQNNCIVAQSGGPTAAINSSLCGVVKTALKSSSIDRVYGAVHGIEGIINGKIIDFGLQDSFEIELLKYTPSSALGSCRYKLKDFNEDESDYKNIFSNFEKYNIRYFFYIGGNDSMDTVDKLSRYAKNKGYEIKIIGIPKTIDNDLYGTDHTPGFGSAAKYVATSIMELSRDGMVYDKGIINIVEIMGRNAGFLTASSALARIDKFAPHLIYLPEIPFNMDRFLKDVKNAYEKCKKVTIAVSEGIRYEDGSFVYEDKSVIGHDRFGHAQMGGVGRILGKVIKDNICKRVKVIEFNVLQRCAIHFASKTDIDEAYKCGEYGVLQALKGESGKMVSLNRISNNPYICELGLVDVSSVANHEKKFPKEWINESGNDITDEALEYLKPLILGEVELPTENGLPRFSKIDF